MVEGVSTPTPASQWLPSLNIGLPTSHSLLATLHTAKEGQLLDCPTMSGSIGAEEIPSPKGFPWKQWLPQSEEGRNGCLGHGSSELYIPIRDAPGSTMWSSAGALPMSCPLLEGDGLLNLEMLDVAEKDHVASAQHLLLLSLFQSLKRRNRSYRYLRSHVLQSQRRLPIWQEDWTLYVDDFHQYHQDMPTWRFGKGYTPRGMTGSPHPGVTASDYLPLPNSQRGTVWVPILGNNSGITATAPVWTLRTIWFPSKDPRTLNEHNVLPTTHKWLHCSSTTWSQKVTRNVLRVHSCLWMMQINTRLLWSLSNLMLPNIRIILSPSTPHSFCQVDKTSPLYDNQCMVLSPDWVSTSPLEWKRTSNQVTI